MLESLQARLIPLNKAYQEIPQAGEFRPIVLLSIIKWIELRLARPLKEYLKTRLSKKQMGFIPGMSPLRELEIKEVDKRKSLRRRVEKTFEGYPVKKHYKYLVIRIDGKGGAVAQETRS